MATLLTIVPATLSVDLATFPTVTKTGTITVDLLGKDGSISLNGTQIVTVATVESVQSATVVGANSHFVLTNGALDISSATITNSKVEISVLYTLNTGLGFEFTTKEQSLAITAVNADANTGANTQVFTFTLSARGKKVLFLFKDIWFNYTIKGMIRRLVMKQSLVLANEKTTVAASNYFSDVMHLIYTYDAGWTTTQKAVLDSIVNTSYKIYRASSLADKVGKANSLNSTKIGLLKTGAKYPLDVFKNALNNIASF